MRNVAVPDMLRVQGLVLLMTVSAFKENLKGFLLFFPPCQAFEGFSFQRKGENKNFSMCQASLREVMFF